MDIDEMSSAFVHISNASGHRLSYQDLFIKQLGWTPSTGKLHFRRILSLILARRILFASIDDDYFGFVMVSVLRAIIFRPTIAIFLRPQTCFQKGRVIYRFKRMVFMLLKLMPFINIISIIPFSVRPEFKKVANDWIHDPQLWDLYVDNSQLALGETALSRRAKNLRNGRKVLVFIGSVTPIKGFPLLVSEVNKHPEVFSDFLIVIAGKVAPECKEEVCSITSGNVLIEDRFVSDDEIYSLYSIADYVWSCYHPSYDQASGVFGRAVQVGCIPIVRRDSFIHQFSVSENIPHVAIEYDQPNLNSDFNLYLTPSFDSEETIFRAKRYLVEAIRKMRSYLET